VSLGSRGPTQSRIRRGTRFVNSYVTTPLCCPSRATFHTGLDAYNHRVRREQQAEGGALGFSGWSIHARPWPFAWGEPGIGPATLEGTSAIPTVMETPTWHAAGIDGTNPPSGRPTICTTSC
jgi:Sulfatase